MTNERIKRYLLPESELPRQWYNILAKAGYKDYYVKAEVEVPAEEAPAPAEEAAPAAEAEKPAKKPAAKKPAAKKATTTKKPAEKKTTAKATKKADK